MEMIERKTFTGETLGVDGKHFIRCKLIKCVLIYGGGDFSFTDTEMTECQFRLDGPAQRTANLLGSMGIDPRAFLQQPMPPQGVPGAAKGEH